MKQDIENIIKKNLPQSIKLKEGGSYYMGFKDCVDNINTSLIADEVLKVFREQIEDLPTLYNSIEHLISKDDILDLLDNLSHNKENE